MSSELHAKELLDSLTGAETILSISEVLLTAQVHATLAVAEELRRLTQVIRERPPRERP